MLGVSWSHGLRCGPGYVRRKRGENGAANRAEAPGGRVVNFLDDPEGPDEALDLSP